MVSLPFRWASDSNTVKSTKTNNMNIQLIQGQFSTQDAVEILTQMVNVKIQFHENKIASIDGEEAIKMREKRIKDLQQDLQLIRERILANGNSISMEAVIQLV